jgi:superfamily I DNA/RNA helicase
MQPSPYGRSDEQQIKVILDDEDRTGVTAAAGSGKTSTVETAIEATHARLFEHQEWRLMDPQIIAICFTRDAVKTLQERLAENHHEGAAKIMTDHSLARKIILGVGEEQSKTHALRIRQVTISQKERRAAIQPEDEATKRINDDLDESFRMWIDTANRYWKQGRKLSYRMALESITEHENGTFNPLKDKALGLKPSYVWWKYLAWIQQSYKDTLGEEIYLDFGMEIIMATAMIAKPTAGQEMDAYRGAQALEIEKRFTKTHQRKQAIGKAISRALDQIVITPSNGSIFGYLPHDDWPELSYHERTDKNVLRTRFWRHVDALFVDEAQDLNRPQIALIEAIHAKRLIAVGDADQNIFGFQGTDRSWLMSFENMIRLPYNYRSTKSIVHVAEQIARNGMRTPSDAPEGLPVQEYHALDEEDEFGYIAKQIEAYLENGLLDEGGEGITILARQRDKADRCRRFITTWFKDKNEPIDYINYATIHSFKGQQAGAVFIIGCCEEKWKDDERDLRNVFYVAATRAMRFLTFTWADKEVFYEARKTTREDHWQGCHRLHLLEGLDGVKITTSIITAEEIHATAPETIDKQLEATKRETEIRKRHSLEVKRSLERIAQKDKQAGEAKTAKRRSSKAGRIEACQTIAGYEHIIKTLENGSTEDYWVEDRHHTDSCKDPLCPGCQRVQTAKKRVHLGAGLWYMHRMTDWINANRALTDDRLGMTNAIFLTLTIKNVPIEKLEAARLTIKQAWHDMAKANSNKGRFKDTAWKKGFWKNAVMGTWPTFEVTLNGGEAHPHLHILIPMRRWYFSDPAAKGVRGRDGKMRHYSDYYLSNRDWAEWWARSIYAAMGANPTDVISKLKRAWIKEEDETSTTAITVNKSEAQSEGYLDQQGWAIPAPGTKDGLFYVDVRRVYSPEHHGGEISEDEAIMEAAKYATKGMNFIPLKRDENGEIIPTISEAEIDQRIKALDETFYNARLQNPTGILRDIFKKADAGQLIDLTAEDPLNDPTIDIDELHRQYIASKDHPDNLITDKRVTSKWDGSHYETINEETIEPDTETATQDATENQEVTTRDSTTLSDENKHWLEEVWHADVSKLTDPYAWL